MKISLPNKYIFSTLVLLLFLGVETWYISVQNQALHVFLWPDNFQIISKEGSKIHLKSSDQQSIYSSVFLRLGAKKKDSFSIKSIEPGTTYVNKDLQIIGLQKDFWRISTSNHVFIFIGKEFETFDGPLPSISLQSDFWIVEKTIIPDILPLPKQGIVYLPSRKPGKTLIQLSIDEQIPLFSLQNTKNIWLKFKNQSLELKQG